jgi:hypothetical protein
MKEGLKIKYDLLRARSLAEASITAVTRRNLNRTFITSRLIN